MVVGGEARPAVLTDGLADDEVDPCEETEIVVRRRDEAPRTHRAEGGGGEERRGAQRAVRLEHGAVDALGGVGGVELGAAREVAAVRRPFGALHSHHTPPWSDAGAPHSQSGGCTVDGVTSKAQPPTSRAHHHR